MKIVSLLSGLAASLFTWVAGYFRVDIGVQFLDLWPETISQQFLGLVLWHVIVAGALVGGVLSVFSPISGAILLLAVTAGWVWLSSLLPIGFVPQTIVPIALAALGALAAFGAMLRGRARRRSEQREPTTEDLEREEALRLVPDEVAVPTFEARAAAPTLPATPATPIRSRVPREDDRPPKGISGGMAVNVAVLLLLTLAIGLLIYVEYRSGDLMAAFTSSVPRASRVGEAPPAEVAAPAPQAAEPASQTAEPAPGEAAEAAPVETAAGGDVAVAPDAWPDPFSYCAAVRTIDFPDERYTGPHLSPEVAEVLSVPASTSPDRVRWRCLEGTVLACSAFGNGAACSITPSVEEMIAYCSENPDASGLDAPNGTWSCAGTRPLLPDDAQWPVDERGFYPAAWQVVVP